MQVSLGVDGILLAASILALRVFRRGEQTRSRRELIPSTQEQSIASTGVLA